MQDKQNLYAWMAGFFDGEGSLSIRLRFDRKNNIHFTRRICITNTSRKMVDIFYDEFGGFIREVKPKKPNRKIVYVWILNGGNDGDIFVSALMPFINLKKRHFEIWVSYAMTLDKAKVGNFGGGIRNWNPDLIKNRLVFIDELTMLNKRGLIANNS